MKKNILVDGNAFVGDRIRLFALIDLFQIERIEVVKVPSVREFTQKDAKNLTQYTRGNFILLSLSKAKLQNSKKMIF